MNSSDARIIAAVVVSLLVSAGAAAVLTGGHQSGIRVDIGWTGDERVFEVEVETDYGFQKYMETGSGNIMEFYGFLEDNVTEGVPIKGVTGGFGCSTFVASDGDGDVQMGRNFDFRQCMPGVVKTTPTYGHASLSTVDMRMFDYDDGDTPEDMVGDKTYFAVPYIPLDGINDAGVSVSINAVNGGPSVHQDTGKTPMFTTSALRLILDFADDVEEAAELVKEYDLRSDRCYHIFVSDASGASVAIEFVGNETIVTEMPLLTNHYLAEEGKDVPVKESSLDRYRTIDATLTATSGVMDRDACFALLRDVSQDDGPSHRTYWSILFDCTGRSLEMCVGMDYAVSYAYAI